MFTRPQASKAIMGDIYGQLITPEAWAKRFEGLEALERLEMETIRRLAALRSDGGQRTILDAGCGTARMRALYPDAAYMGIDSSPQFIRYCQRHRESFSATFLLADIDHLPFPPETFDLVLVIGTLESERDPRTRLGELIRYVRPGGRLVFTLQNRRNVPGRLANVFGRRYHQTFWSRRELVRTLSASNLPFEISTCFLTPPGVFRALFSKVLGWRRAQRLVMSFFLILERANIRFRLHLGYQWIAAVARPAGRAELR